jgi:hypothetical protein
MGVLLFGAIKGSSLGALVAPSQTRHFLLPVLGLTLAPDLPAGEFIAGWPTIEDDEAGDGFEGDFLGFPLDSFFISLAMEISCLMCVTLQHAQAVLVP